jgi:hypothetical protein
MCKKKVGKTQSKTCWVLNACPCHPLSPQLGISPNGKHAQFGAKAANDGLQRFV